MAAAVISMSTLGEFGPQEDARQCRSLQVPTRKRSQRPRCPRVQLEETYYLSSMTSQSLDGTMTDSAEDAESADSAEDEEAAALLLGMGHLSDPQPARRRSSSPRSADTTSVFSGFRCSSCRQPAVLRGEKRPTFFCASCPSKGGAQKRAQRALHGTEDRIISVSEATEILHGKFGRPQPIGQPPSPLALHTQVQAQQRGPCPPIFQAVKPAEQEGAAGFDRGQSIPLQPRGADPEWLPANTLARASSEGGEANQGRCKCGKRISAAHPPCKSELMLLCEKFQARFGDPSANGSSLILLNEAAIELSVPRRRLYDIINVLEAVEIVSRTGKLAYEWRGLKHLPELLDRLVADQLAGVPVEDRMRRTPAAPARASGTNAGSGEDVSGNEDPPAAHPSAPASKAAPTHSLWMLSRKFVRLLLTTQGPIPLADAAAALIGSDVASHKRPQAQITVERRLYDIGSILSSVGLIEKTYLGKRQPAFSWRFAWRSNLPKPAAPGLTGPAAGNASNTSSATAQGLPIGGLVQATAPSSPSSVPKPLTFRGEAVLVPTDIGGEAKRRKSEDIPRGFSVPSSQTCMAPIAGHAVTHSMAPVPMPVHLAWPQMGYAPGLSMPVPLHMLAAHFPQAYSTAAGSGPDMAALWASLPLPNSLSGNNHRTHPPMRMVPPQAAAPAAAGAAHCARSLPFGGHLPVCSTHTAPAQRQ